MSPFGNSERLVLDTSAYSNLRIGHTAVIESIAAAVSVFLPTVALGELQAGFLLGSREKENLRGLYEFLEEPFVSVIDITREVSRNYAVIFTQLKKSGTPIPINDIWIAASTISSNATLITFDKHFDRIPNLSCLVFE